MAEDAVRGKVVCSVHEMRSRRGCFSGSAYAAFGIAHDVVIQVHESRFEERFEREDDRCSKASGIGYQSGLVDLLSMQFGNSIYGLGLRLKRGCRALVLKAVDCAIGGLFEPPCAAQVDHAK